MNLNKFSRIPYVGHPNNSNLGDKVLYQLCLQYLGNKIWIPWKQRNRVRDHFATLRAKYFIVGGGSLLFTDPTLDKIQRWIDYGKRPLLFGTGSRDLDISNQVRCDIWRTNLIAPNIIHGVRGLFTQKYLNKIGVVSQAIGDPGFLVNLKYPRTPEPENYIVISPRLNSSTTLSEVDGRSVKLLYDYLKNLDQRKLKVKIFPASSEDLGVCAYLHACFPQTELVPNGNNQEIPDHLNVLSKAKLVISVRMHTGIFALAGGTPVIYLENRSKYKDTLSVIPNISTLMDPVLISSDQLIDRAENYLNESFSKRTQRFKTIRNLATHQMKYLNQLKDSIK